MQVEAAGVAGQCLSAWECLQTQPQTLPEQAKDTEFSCFGFLKQSRMNEISKKK